MITLPIITEKAVSGFRIDLEREVFFIVREGLVNCINVLLGDEAVLAAKQEGHAAVDLTRTFQRAWFAQGDSPPIEDHSRFDVLVVMRRGEVGKTPSHAKPRHPDGPLLYIAL